MTQYKAEFTFPALFPSASHKSAEWLSVNGLTQFHCAVTFFNGGVEKQFANEERCLVVSPKVATYDLEPPVSSAAVADKVIEQLHIKNIHLSCAILHLPIWLAYWSL
uniref:Metalloenzyme domain-containing protein n=1 Tax=Wuchereria bancrofti TaxID=6293 RepID=A0A1I8ERW3_WUCBA